MYTAEPWVSRVEPTLGSPLSPAEVAVLMLLSEGWTQAEVRFRLRISQKTLTNHLSSILPRLGAVSSLHACVIYARAH